MSLAGQHWLYPSFFFSFFLKKKQSEGWFFTAAWKTENHELMQLQPGSVMNVTSLRLEFHQCEPRWVNAAQRVTK